MSDVTYWWDQFYWENFKFCSFLLYHVFLTLFLVPWYSLANQQLVYNFCPAFMWLLCPLHVPVWLTAWLANKMWAGWTNALAHNWLVNFVLLQANRTEWKTEAASTLGMGNVRYVAWRLCPGKGWFFVCFSSSLPIIWEVGFKVSTETSSDFLKINSKHQHTRSFDIWTEGNYANSRGQKLTTRKVTYMFEIYKSGIRGSATYHYATLLSFIGIFVL